MTGRSWSWEVVGGAVCRKRKSALNVGDQLVPLLCLERRFKTEAAAKALGLGRK